MSPSLFFDIRFGASGDMLAGSLIDLGLDPSALETELRKLNVDGWSFSPARISKYGLAGHSAGIRAEDDHHARHLSDILSLVNTSPLTARVKESIEKVFRRLAEAEARVHNSSPEQVHFHETGAVDSIIDIAAFCVGIDMLKAGAVYFNEFHFGKGTVMSHHGELPVPVPAVVQLTKGFRARFTEREGELVTPTAAAILTALGVQRCEELPFGLLGSGTGFGTRPYPFPSYTRVFLLEEETGEGDSILQIDANIDDMNPQLFPYLMDKLFAAGVLDAFLTPVTMKKGRPGMLITVLAEQKLLEPVRDLLYTESTTLGIRYFRVTRDKMKREFTPFRVGEDTVMMKTGYHKGVPVNVHPEYEDCRKLAEKEGKPLKEVIKRVMAEFSDGDGSDGA